MKVSIIITTYNSPKWLEKVLWGLNYQTDSEFEIIIADDGSKSETKQLIEKYQLKYSFIIKHIWHEDKGFRKCEILNKAILKSQFNYIIFLDGDCIPRSDFVHQHKINAQKNTFLTGSVIRLPMSLSQLINEEHIKYGDCFNWSWLRKNGLPNTRKNSKIKVNYFWGKVLNVITTARKNFTGGNASAWKSDLIHVGGFDQRMSWGGVDREIGVRLKNAGIKAKHVRYNAMIIHLDHARGYADPDNVKRNKALRKYNEKNKIKVTEYGIKNLLK